MLDTPRAEPCAHGPSRRVIAGGSEPDRGPADVDPSLGKKRSVKLKVRTTWSPSSGGAPLESTSSVTLRR